MDHMDHSGFVRGLVKSRATRAVIAEFLEISEEQALPWEQLPGALGAELDRFERSQIACGLARVQGGRERAIERRQDFLERTAVTSILFPLEAFEDRLLHLIEQRGLTALSHHLVREFADAGADTEVLFETTGACRLAAFAIEDLLLATAEEPFTAAGLVEKRNEIVSHLWSQLNPTAVPFEWCGIALFWVTALAGLGGMADNNTTDHYPD